MTVDQCERLIELVGQAAVDASEEERVEMRGLVQALRDEIVRLDDEGDEEPEFVRATPEEFAAAHARSEAIAELSAPPPVYDGDGFLIHTADPAQRQITEEKLQRMMELDANRTAQGQPDVTLMPPAYFNDDLIKSEFSKVAEAHLLEQDPIARHVRETWRDHASVDLAAAPKTDDTLAGIERSAQTPWGPMRITQELLDRVKQDVILVEDPVPAGSLPPDELVFRKAKP